MPFDAALQLPDHRKTVLLESVILLARNLGCEDWNQIAVRIPSCQRLIEDAAGLLVLGSHREMRIEQGWSLPIEQLECPAPTGLGWLVGNCGCGLCDSRLAQHHSGHWRGQANRKHALHECAARQAPNLDLCDQV